MKTAQHERIEIVSDEEIRIERHYGSCTCFTVAGDALRETDSHSAPVWDCAGLAARALAVNCFRQTGNFKALRDGEVALFVGGKVRDWTGNTRSVLLIQEERCWLTTLEWTNKNDLLPLILPLPRVRPYTPREAVEFLGRKTKTGKLKTVSADGLTVVNNAGGEVSMSYRDFVQHYTWADTGEPCGVIEENTNA